MDHIQIGQKVAREIFKNRGDHSEVHVSQLELAAICAMAANIAAQSHADLIAALEAVVYDIDNSDGLHSVDARTEDKVKAALAKAGVK